LRAAGLIAIGGGGGRNQKAEAHFRASHLLNLVWGLAGHLPSDAAETAAVVNALRRVGPDEARPTMGEAMAETLTAAAEHARTRAMGGPPEPWPVFPAAVVITMVGTRSAEVHWPGGRPRDLFVPVGPYQTRGDIARTTTIGRRVLAAAVALLVDTLDHQARLAGPPNEKRRIPGKGSGATRDETNRSSNAETGDLNSPKIRKARAQTQAHSASRVGRSLFLTGDDDHDRGYPEPAPTG